MSARSIHNLVRALYRPYPGAHCVYQGAEVKIWRTRISSGEACENIEPGKILASSSSGVKVKCGEGVIEILEHGFAKAPAEGEYL
jgi:methionyl-tRNA formyltransferase